MFFIIVYFELNKTDLTNYNKYNLIKRINKQLNNSSPRYLCLVNFTSKAAIDAIDFVYLIVGTDTHKKIS
jgi:hypothetical protein